jgi:hypothetical protein
VVRIIHDSQVMMEGASEKQAGENVSAVDKGLNPEKKSVLEMVEEKSVLEMVEEMKFESVPVSVPDTPAVEAEKVERKKRKHKKLAEEKVETSTKSKKKSGSPADGEPKIKPKSPADGDKTTPRKGSKKDLENQINALQKKVKELETIDDEAKLPPAPKTPVNPSTERAMVAMQALYLWFDDETVSRKDRLFYGQRLIVRITRAFIKVDSEKCTTMAGSELGFHGGRLCRASAHREKIVSLLSWCSPRSAQQKFHQNLQKEERKKKAVRVACGECGRWNHTLEECWIRQQKHKQETNKGSS